MRPAANTMTAAAASTQFAAHDRLGRAPAIDTVRSPAVEFSLQAWAAPRNSAIEFFSRSSSLAQAGQFSKWAFTVSDETPSRLSVNSSVVRCALIRWLQAWHVWLLVLDTDGSSP